MKNRRARLSAFLPRGTRGLSLWLLLSGALLFGGLLRLGAAHVNDGVEVFWQNDWEYYGIGVQLAETGQFRPYPGLGPNRLPDAPLPRGHLLGPAGQTRHRRTAIGPGLPGLDRNSGGLQYLCIGRRDLRRPSVTPSMPFAACPSARCRFPRSSPSSESFSSCSSAPGSGACVAAQTSAPPAARRAARAGSFLPLHAVPPSVPPGMDIPGRRLESPGPDGSRARPGKLSLSLALGGAKRRRIQFYPIRERGRLHQPLGLVGRHSG